MPSAKETKPNVEPAGGPEPGFLAQTTRNILLFYFGAAATVIEESYDLFGRLVEHGKTAEQEGRQRIRRLVERRQEEAERAEREAIEQVRGAMNRLAIPSKQDIEALDQQITQLSQKIDGLAAPK